ISAPLSPQKMQLVTTELLLKLDIPPPVGELFPLNVELITDGLLLAVLNIPPPRRVALFPMNVQLITDELLTPFSIPPPAPAKLPVKVQLITVALLLPFSIPPPSEERFPVKVQSVTVGLPPNMFTMPPPPTSLLGSLLFPRKAQWDTVGLLRS